jgi:hypothetical protein
MRRWYLALFCCLTLCTFPVSPVAAQETTATATGTVTDQSGGVLPGVTVSFKHVATGRLFESITNTEGNYLAPLLPVGAYEVTFSLSGFQPRVVEGLTLAVNDRVKVDATLSAGGVSEVVHVTGRTTITQTTTAVQELIDSQRVQELPINNRNFAKLAELAPGVSSDLADEATFGLTSTMSISVNGARRNAVNWLVDGVMNVDVGSNITLLSTPTLESIEQFKIITSSYAAEWPRSGGGIINVVTKSGTNKYAGSGYEFFRSDALNSNSYFRKQSTDPAVRDNPAELKYNNFGFTVGGPLAKDKLFFFFSEELRKVTRAPASQTVNVPNPEWLTNPASSNYVAPAERSPIAMQLLQAYPQPNASPLTADAPGRYLVPSPNLNDTRQEVIRMDYDLSNSQRMWGRYTHDLSETREIQGLFLGAAYLPGVAGTDTTVPGQVAAFGLRSIIGSNKMNEVTYHFSSNNITSQRAEGVKNTKADYGVTIPEVFPENANGLVPFISITGLNTIGANQLFRIQYLNNSISDNFSWQRGNHAFKFGGLATFEQKNENAASQSQGNFAFVATTGSATAFQNFLRGNAAAACTGCSYTEAERDIDMNLRFNRFEFYAQDTWRPTARLTVDYGVRYSLYPPITDKNNLLVTFDPSTYVASQAPPFANAAGTLIDRTTGNLLVGIIQGGVNSPYGDGIYKFEKGAIQPRAGFAYDLSGQGDTIVRSGFGIYYDQPLVGIFEQNAFTMPPVVNNVTFTNPTLANPASGQTATTTGVRTIQATAPDFKNPRTTQWNVGVTHRFASRILGEISYVGSRGDNLIRPTDINYPDPARVVQLQTTVAGAVNPVRPYQSYGAITYRETTARANYHGLLTSTKIDAGENGSVTLNYTLSRNRTDATNDRDGVDIPQDPNNPELDSYADARTDRRHIFNGSFTYELPFFRHSGGVAEAVAGGWQVAGIVNISSGQPVSRVSVLSDTFRRGTFADLVGDINAGERFVNGIPYWFNPDAFAPPAAGTFGNSGRAPFRQPGRYQWDLNFSKNFYPTESTRLQFRVEMINAFDQLQWLSDPNVNGMDNTCTTSNTVCNVAGDRFGQLTATRAPREIQLGVKLYW